MSSQQTTYTSTNTTTAPMISQVLLPTQVIEKPVAIHEEIRREMIEEVQPVINVEKLKTEVHQVTQPLFDKEVRPVQIESRTLATEVLPEVLVQGRGTRAVDDMSTTRFLDTATVVVEKPAIINEVEKRQIIEEIQPVIYKETIVPTVIQETKPIYQKITEGAVYTHETRAAEEVAIRSTIAPAYVPDTTVVAPINQRVMLPTQVIEKPVAVHEEIRRETIEEIQPVVNVEKVKTEIHQITAPLYDREIMPVQVEKRVLAQEYLPEVLVEGRGVRSVEDVSTTRFLDTKTVLIEKPAIYTEVERTQIIEEIQPVVYKETVVPTVIRETKPVYQKIVEGPVYTQETLAARPLSESGFHYPTQRTVVEVPASVPVITRQVVAPVHVEHVPVHVERVVAPVVPVVPLVHHQKTIVEDTVTTTTTTTVAPTVAVNAHAPAAKEHHGLFHRSHDKHVDTHHVPTGTTVYSTSTQPLTTGMNNMNIHGTGIPHVEHQHVERTVGGSKVVEDVTTTTTHSQTVVPSKLV